jgi:hypothetical protein
MLKDKAHFYAWICVTRKENCLVLYCAFTNSRRSSAHINVTLGCAQVTTVAVEKQAVLCILTVEIVALVIQHAKRMSRITVPSVACLEMARFFTLFHERQDFRKYIIENKICFGFLYNFARKISHYKKNSERYFHKCI